jgi:hypothetical protein
MMFAIKNKQTGVNLLAKAMSATAFHVISGSDKKNGTAESKNPPAEISTGVCVIAKEVNGNIVSYRELGFRKRLEERAAGSSFGHRQDAIRSTAPGGKPIQRPCSRQTGRKDRLCSRKRHGLHPDHV